MSWVAWRESISCWIGIDDTDSLSGMCTTWLLTEVIRDLSEYDVIGYPRLVRLNPMIPWKTRGNGALAVRLGRGTGKRHWIGCIKGTDIWGYNKERVGGVFDIGEASSRLDRLFDRHAVMGDGNTNPAYVISCSRLSPKLYSNAVRKVVRIEDAEKALQDTGAIYRGYKNRRGLIGASAAVAWHPLDRTYEIIAYRSRNMWGKPRNVDPLSVIAMDEAFPETFNNYDYENKHTCIAPSSPCPVLFGIRADYPDRLRRASAMVRTGEEFDRMFIFMSNQGTDDHLRPMDVSRAMPHECAVLTGNVINAPRIIQGGHTIFPLEDSTGRIDCVAYEPSKKFRRLVAQLLPKDRIRVWGGIREKPLSLNIEKLEVLMLARPQKKTANPMCGVCSKRMKSMGSGAGYRCAKCGARAAPDSGEMAPVERKITEGIYEPPASARRHLSKPIKRMRR